jgi:hypothetical protein
MFPTTATIRAAKRDHVAGGQQQLPTGKVVSDFYTAEWTFRANKIFCVVYKEYLRAHNVWHILILWRLNISFDSIIIPKLYTICVMHFNNSVAPQNFNLSSCDYYEITLTLSEI